MSGRAARAAKVRKRLFYEKVRRELMLMFREAVMKAVTAPLIPANSPLLQCPPALANKAGGHGRFFSIITQQKDA